MKDPVVTEALRQIQDIVIQETGRALEPPARSRVERVLASAIGQLAGSWKKAEGLTHEVTILLARTGLDGSGELGAGAGPGGDTLRLAEAVVGFANELRAEPEVETGPSVRATLASFELALAWARLDAGGHPRTPGDGTTDWRAAAVAGLRVALRGRLSLRPTHRLASRPEVYVEDALAALSL